MKLKLIKEDEKLIARKMEIEINKKTFEVPTKSFELIYNKKSSPFSLLDKFSQKAHGLIEFRVSFSQENILLMDGDEIKMNRFISSIKTRLSNTEDNILFFVPIYTIKKSNISKNEIEYISSFLLSLWRYGVIDIFSIPIVKEQLKRKKGFIFRNLDTELYFKNFVEPLLNEMFSYNGDKLASNVIGYIPKVSHRQIAEIVNFYFKHFITNFVVDLNASTPINYSPALERLIKTVLNIEKEIKREGTFLHGLNLNRGLGKRNIEKIAAKDIIGFCQGITSFSFPFKPAFKPEEPVFRVFKPADYAYYKYSIMALENLREKENLLRSTNLKDVEKAVNTKLLYGESKTIRERLEERKFLDHINTKKEIQIYLKKLQKFSNNVKTKSIGLREFLK